jgi:hypothetical protein
MVPVAVGDADGLDAVGCGVGAAVGLALAVAVGSGVGIADGGALGFAVGVAVTPDNTVNDLFGLRLVHVPPVKYANQ